MQIDTVVYYMVTDPKLYTYGHDNPMVAIEKSTATTIRNIIGDLELDETLTSRELINSRMRLVLDEVSDPWGIKVVRVEVKNIIPPHDIQVSMERQMKAERGKREAILRAEGEKSSAILRAEGDKESTILHAEAEKSRMVTVAEGEAAAIVTMGKANADAVSMLKEAGANEYVIALRGLETLEKVADGTDTKIIIPTDLASLAGLSGGLSNVLKKAPAAK
jgi:regulator of protease activity HflC (stomatin/prohibitin superfamily)